MKGKVKLSNTVANRLFLRQKNLTNKFEPQEISSHEEAIEIGIRMAKIAGKTLKLDFAFKDQAC